MKRINSLDDKFNEITFSINKLYCLLHVAKIYTEDKGVCNQEISNIDTLMDVLVKEIDTLISYI